MPLFFLETQTKGENLRHSQKKGHEMRKYVYPGQILNLGQKQTYTIFSDELAKKWNLDATLRETAMQRGYHFLQKCCPDYEGAFSFDFAEKRYPPFKIPTKTHRFPLFPFKEREIEK